MDRKREGGKCVKQQLEVKIGARQEQRLIINVAMAHAFTVLQLPALELKEWLDQEIEHNPVLKITSFPSESFDLTQIPHTPTRYEQLLKQIALYFDRKEEQEVARKFAASLDSNGFLTLSPEEIMGEEALLKKFQRMDFLGMGARNAQEALLIQLEGEKEELLYRIVAHHYELLLHRRYQEIAKSVGATSLEVEQLVKGKLRLFNPFPGRGFAQESRVDLFPDLIFEKEESRWSIRINDFLFPSFEIDPFYLNGMRKRQFHPQEMKEIERYVSKGRWLEQIVHKRGKLLLDIGNYLLKHQSAFLEGSSHAPEPMVMKELAHALGVSESTITRAVKGKGVAAPRGVFLLRRLFNQGLAAPFGRVSKERVQEQIKRLIAKESQPLSDRALSELLSKEGLSCSRRTVAKYRKALNIGSTFERDYTDRNPKLGNWEA